jgi:microcin C transport system substrate-binding protein
MRVTKTRSPIGCKPWLAKAVFALMCMGQLATAAFAQAEPASWTHALSLLSKPKYGPDFTHFDYVNPDAPKTGQVRMGAQGGFDNFNPVVAGVKGQLDAGVGLVYETLSTASLDEVMTSYGVLAEAMRVAPDVSSVTYRLRANARWHDGKPITPEDVIFSFDAFKTYSPQYAFYYAHVSKAEKTGEREVTFVFDQPGNRELPQIVGQFLILPRHHWEGIGPDGKKRDISQTTLEPPLGSGPYRMKTSSAPQYTIYERVPDYWGKDVPARRGTFNFAEYRYDYFRDTTVLLEAFKGDQIDFRAENSAKNWATAYDFPAVKTGRVKREEFQQRATGRMQAFIFNLRREPFKDQRVRRAFNLAFDFEEMNKTVFYGQYQRISSFFEGSELAARGLPEGLEKQVLESLAPQLPAPMLNTILTVPYANPVAGSPDAVRNNLRQADQLLKEAGYGIKDGKRVNAAGQPFKVELLAYDSSFERVLLFFKPSLERLGITVTVRIVDPSQYENRMRSFDFDITTDLWAQSLSPGNEQREYWGSKAALREGSRNTIGIQNPAIDALIDRLAFAKSREEQVAVIKALDRVLLAHDYVVPQWTYLYERTARWDRFDHPAVMPLYGASAFPTIWWYDEERAKRTGKGG